MSRRNPDDAPEQDAMGHTIARQAKTWSAGEPGLGIRTALAIEPREALRRIYVNSFGIGRAWTFHEAADVENFRPLASQRDCDVLWLGNWGDEERTQELEEFLLCPAEELPEFTFVAHGVRYPREAQEKLRQAGIQFRGYLPNLEAAASPDAAITSAVTRAVFGSTAPDAIGLIAFSGWR